MEKNEKEHIIFKWGLALKRIIERNKTIALHKKGQGAGDKNIINSFGRLEAASGIPKATLVNISLGRKNAASSTWAVILEALALSMADFGQVFDSIRDKDIIRYREEIEAARKARASAKNARKRRFADG